MNKELIKFLSFLLLTVGMQFKLQGQVTYTIGAGSGTSSALPINTCQSYNYSQQIYKRTELNAVGIMGPQTISQIKFYYVSGSLSSLSTWQNWNLYLGNTTMSTFSSSSNWIAESSMSLVFSGPVSVISSNSWFTITLSTPFVWDGQSNLVVAVDENSPGTICTRTFGSFSSSSTGGIISLVYSGLINTSPAAPPVATYTSSTNRSRLQFVMTPTPCSGVPNPGNTVVTSASVCQGDLVSLSLQNEFFGTGVLMQWQESIDNVVFSNINGETSSSCSVSPLSTMWYRCSIECSGLQAFSNPVQVVVNTLPNVLFSIPDQNICSSSAFQTIGLTSSLPNVNFYWISQSNGVLGVIDFASGVEEIASTLLINNSNLPVFVVYSVYAEDINTGCVGSASDYSVLVEPEIYLTNPNSVSVCTGVTMNLDLTSNTPSTYSWSATANSNVTGIPIGNQTSDPINLTLTNTTTVNQTVTFQVTPTSTSGNCVGTTQTITVTVLPTPIMTSASALTICDNTNVNLALTATVPSNFSWIATSNTNVNGESTTAQSSSTINNTLDNTTNTNQIVTYTVTPTSSTGSCAGNAQTVNVTVVPTPVMTNSNTASVCSGTALNIGLTSNNGTSFSWVATSNVNVNGESTTAVNSSTINNTLTNTTNAIQVVTYTITPSTSNPTCPGTPFTLSVSVVPAVTVNPISPVTICNNLPLNIPITSNVPSSFSWSTTDNTNITGESTTAVNSSTINDLLNNTSTSQQSLTYTITPTSTTGSCVGSPLNVTVNVVPTVTVTSSNTSTVCSGIPININLTSNVASSFSWQAANNPNTTGETTTLTNSSTINNTIISNSTSAQNVVYTITPTSNVGSCIGTAQTLTVTVNPAPSMTNVNTVNVCSGSSVNLSLTSNVASTYNWVATANNQVGGESTTAQTGNTINDVLTNTTSAIQTVTYTVTPNSSSGTCPGSPQTVTVSVIPNVTLSNPATQSICSGTALNYSFTSNIPASYSWSAADNANVTGESTTSQNSSSITNTLVNTTNNANQNVVYTIIPTSVQGSCPASSVTFTVTVIPTPVITNTLTKTICSGQTVNQSLTASYTGTINWSATNNPNISGETLTNSTLTTINDLLNNSTNTAQTVTYNLSATTTPGSCASSIYNLLVTVNPTPVVSNVLQTICSGQTFIVTPTTTIVPTGTTYSWTAPTNASITSGLANGNAQNNISGTLVSSSSSSTTVTYVVTPTSNLNCTGANFNVVVTVNPKPNVGDLTATICSGQTFSVTPNAALAGNNIPSGTTYTWTAPTGTGFTGGSAQSNGQTSIGQVLTNTTANPVTATYTVTPTSTAGCAGLPFTVTVTINPAPNVTFEPAPQTICSGATFSDITLSSTTTGAVFSWTATPGSITGATTSGSGTTISGVALTNPTNAPLTITYSATAQISGSTCPGPTATYIITVNPKPAITTINQTICSGSTFTVTPVNATNGIVPAGTSYTWTTPTLSNPNTVNGSSAQSTGVANISQTLTNVTNIQQTVTYNVTPNTTNNCPGSAFNVVITVNPTPVIPAQTLTTCGGTQTSLNLSNNQPTTILPTSTTFSWSIPGSLVSLTGATAGNALTNFQQTLTNTSNTAQTATYSVTPTTGSCTGTPFNVVITVNPTPVVSAATATICSGQTFTVTPTGPIIPLGTLYSWSQPQNSQISAGLSEGNLLPLISGQLISNVQNSTQVNYNITPQSPTGCAGSTFSLSVIVNPTPVIEDYTISICSGASFSVNPSSISGNIIPPGIVYNWDMPSGFDFSGASTNQALIPSLYYSQNWENYTNTAGWSTNWTNTTTNPCQGTRSVRKTISSTSTAGAFSSPLLGISNGLQATLSFEYKIVNVTNGLATPSSFGSIEIQYSSGPSGPWQALAVINSSNHVASVSCAPKEVQFTPAVGNVYVRFNCNYSAGNYYVYFDNIFLYQEQEISQTLLTNNSNPVVVHYDIMPVNSLCAANSFGLDVTINPLPAISFNIPSQTICSGTATTEVQINSQTNNATFYWQASSTGISNYISSGNAAVFGGEELFNSTATSQNLEYQVHAELNGCVGAEQYYLVTVQSTPTIMDTIVEICSGSLLEFSPLNSGGNVIPEGTQYYWNFNNQSVLGLIEGESVQTTPQSYFEQTLINTTNVALSIQFNLMPITLENCVGDTIQIEVVVNPTPAISDQYLAACSGTTAVMQINSNDPGVILPSDVSYSWTVEDVAPNISGATAGIDQNVFVQNLVNSSDITEMIAYSAYATNGNCNSDYFQIVIQVNPTPIISSGALVVCSGQGFEFTPTGSILPENLLYSWPLPTGAGISGAQSGSMATSISGTLISGSNINQYANYIITPSTNEGCVGSGFSLTVTIAPSPVINNISANICSGATFAVVPSGSVPGNIIPAGTTYTWLNPIQSGVAGGTSQNNGVSLISQTLTNLTSVIATAIYPVTANTIYGCQSSPFNVVVTVQPSPIINFSTAAQSICSGNAFTDIQLTSPTSNVQFSWSASATNVNGQTLTGNSSTIPGTVLTNTSNSTQVVVYSVVAHIINSVCTSAPYTTSIAVIAQPQFTLQPLSENLCEGGDINPLCVQISNTSISAQYQWYFLDEAISANVPIPGANGNCYDPVSNSSGSYSYFVQVNFSDLGCSPIFSQTAVVQVINDPVISTTFPISQSICVGGVADLVQVQATGGVGTFNYQWYDANTNAALSGQVASSLNLGVVSSVGMSQFFVVVSQSGDGCDDLISDTVDLMVVSDPIISGMFNVDQTLCQGSETLPLILSVTGGVDVTYQWYESNDGSGAAGNIIAGATQNTYSPPSEAIDTILYQCIISSSVSGCNSPMVSLPFVINVLPQPKITSVVDSVAGCLNYPFNPISVEGNLPNDAFFSFYNSNTVGSYDGNLISSSNYAPASNSIGTSTYYFVYDSALPGCEPDTSEFYYVQVLPPAMITSTAENGLLGCSGASFNLEGLLATDAGYNYYLNWYVDGVIWDTTTGFDYQTPMMNDLGTHELSVVMIDNMPNCDFRDSLMLPINIINDPIIVGELNFDQTVCPFSSDFLPFQLQVSYDGNVSALNFQWYEVIEGANSLVETNSTGMYQITGLSSDHPLYWGLVWSNEPGCNADTSQFTNILLEDNSSICFPSLIIPAAISPDQDGYNDYWEIEGLADFKNYKVVVFNQNGQEMYTVHNELPHWDGTWRGVPLPNGDYYYSLYFEDIGKSIFGTVSLKR